MKKIINLSFLFTLLTYLIQIRQILSLNTKKLRSELNCSEYENDNDIIDSFPFSVSINPIRRDSDLTYALMDKDYNIYHLNIFNEKEVPSLIYCFKRLSQLIIKNTNFRNSKQGLPAEIGNLACSLIELLIYDTKITHLPEEINQLIKLEVLILSNTGLTFLPDAIGDLSALTVLNIPNNNLKSLPITMKNLRSLRRITLTNNRNLHSIKPLNSLPSLETIDTQNCPIEVLPQNLPKLFSLYMINNNLTKLTGIQTLGSREHDQKYFYFDQNRIRTITPQIRCVQNLSHLSLSQNQLHTLPEDLYTVTTLSFLNIQRNPIQPIHLKQIVDQLKNKIPNITILHD